MRMYDRLADEDKGIVQILLDCDEYIDRLQTARISQDHEARRQIESPRPPTAIFDFQTAVQQAAVQAATAAVQTSHASENSSTKAKNVSLPKI